MDAEDAIEIIETFITPKFRHSGKSSIYLLIDQACEEAVYVLSKQIPMKPIELKNDKDLKIGASIWRAGVPVYKCPECGAFISRSNDYCGKCGKKIKWRKTNERK